MKLIERHHSRHTPTQIFDLVADVERYPDFVPWVVAARVIRRQDKIIWTNLTMGTLFLSKQFTTAALLERPHRMEINSHDPIFEHFQQIWTFESATEGGTNVEYRVDVEIKSHLLQVLLEASFAEGATTMVKAYMRRAQHLYGTLQTVAANVSPHRARTKTPSI